MEVPSFEVQQVGDDLHLNTSIGGLVVLVDVDIADFNADDLYLGSLF
jgi:hypothetical protein